MFLFFQWMLMQYREAVVQYRLNSAIIVSNNCDHNNLWSVTKIHKVMNKYQAVSTPSYTPPKKAISHQMKSCNFRRNIIDMYRAMLRVSLWVFFQYCCVSINVAQHSCVAGYGTPVASIFNHCASSMPDFLSCPPRHLLYFVVFSSLVLVCWINSKKKDLSWITIPAIKTLSLLILRT